MNGGWDCSGLTQAAYRAGRGVLGGGGGGYGAGRGRAPGDPARLGLRVVRLRRLGAVGLITHAGNPPRSRLRKPAPASSHLPRSGPGNRTGSALAPIAITRR
ncbi:hypothetical protein [Nocardia cyriacigeorgica]|uniref:hypothetical protein n=1 Tax=Nocardia cyriacigeorgica TaxID=135487 RepID=UPI003CC7D4F8